jgi:hypothetical protein
MIRLCPPVAATSKDRVMCSRPLTSEKSISKSLASLNMAELSVYFALKNLVLWAKPFPHCGGQSSMALPEESLQEFEVN